MPTSNVTDWGVSYIDQIGAYHGDVVISGGGANANFRVKSGGEMQLLNVTDSKWHSIWIQDVQGTPTIMVASTGEE